MNPTVLVAEEPAVRPRLNAQQEIVARRSQTERLSAVVIDGPEVSTADLDEFLGVVGSAEDLSSGVAVGTLLVIMLGDLQDDRGPDQSSTANTIST